jgi:hypothetical protein
VNTWNEVSSYIPQSLKSTISANLPLTEKAAPREKNFILSTSFDSVPINGVPHLVLIVCYENGFQVCRRACVCVCMHWQSSMLLADLRIGENFRCCAVDVSAHVHDCQVWDLDDPNNVHELVSKHDVPIRCATFLAQPIVEETEGW